MKKLVAKSVEKSGKIAEKNSAKIGGKTSAKIGAKILMENDIRDVSSIADFIDS